MKRLQHTFKRQRGSVLVLITGGVIALLGATALAVDIGYAFYFKGALQNAADSAVLAGAQGLIAGGGDRELATDYAIEYAGRNKAGGEPVVLNPEEVTFPTNSIVRVDMVRPAGTFFGKVLGLTSIDIGVNAAAWVAPASGGTGMRPFTLLDQFGHGPCCVGPNDETINDPPHGEFKTTSHNWCGITVPRDHYKSPYDPEFDGWDLSREGDCSNVTGLIAPRDVDGRRVRLKSGSNWLLPGNFGAAAFEQTGADAYEYAIAYGSPSYVQIGDILDTEPGNMTGPTRSGVDELVAQDPTARMVRRGSTWVVESDEFPLNESPRIVAIPLYSVLDPPDTGRSDPFRVDNIASFFIVDVVASGDVVGYFIFSRLKGARPGEVPRGGSPGGGRLVGTVQLISPDNIQ